MKKLKNKKRGNFMTRIMGLWLLGVPVVVIILLKVFGII
jgi:hypothetical protein